MPAIVKRRVTSTQAESVRGNTRMKMTSLFVLASCWVLGASQLSPFTGQFFNLDVSDKAFKDDLIFEFSASSLVECASRCYYARSCKAFTFHPTTCRGHAILLTSSAVSVLAAGARSFGRDWRYLPCASNSDCTVTNAVCFKGRCLCTPGYFYSVGTTACVKNCTELQPTYSMYPESGIQGYNWKGYNDSNPAQCQAYCTADPVCLTLELKLNGKCYTSKHTPLSKPEKWMTTHAGPPHAPWLYFFQRDCS